MLRVGIVADYREEGWASMDLTADMLLQYLASTTDVAGVRVQAPFRHRIGRLTRSPQGASVDRIVNRFFDYPRWLRAQNLDVDLYHIVDHSYAHLVHVLPRERTVVTCHDVDAFRPFIGGSSGSRLPRRLARRVLDGLRAARSVTCVSETTRAELIRYGLVAADRLVVVPQGVHPACSPLPNSDADRQAASLLGPAGVSIDLLHVGSTVERKRVDIALDITAAVARRFADVRLVRVGGPLTAAQRRQARDLRIDGRILELPFLRRDVVAAVYRRAALVLMPSDREGFGLPVVEALACGTPVVASDIPALREVGGEAAVFCSAGDRAAWVETVTRLLGDRRDHPAVWRARQDAGLARSQLFTWTQSAAGMAAVYRSLIGRQAWAPTA